jgi:hypothetical protein
MSTHPYYPRFTYFNQQIKDFNWQNSKILDYGGNWGNLLRDPTSTVPQENYWCIDISEDAIESGESHYPNAHWYHYDKWNHCYNSGGCKDATLPDFETKFDLITAFSVVTHVTEQDMLDIVYKDLFPLLAPGGILAFTLLEPSSLIYFAKKRGLKLTDITKVLSKASTYKDRFYYTNSSIISGVDEVLPLERSDFFVSFYAVDTARELFKDHLLDIKPPTGDEIQYCVLLKNPLDQAK